MFIRVKKSTKKILAEIKSILGQSPIWYELDLHGQENLIWYIYLNYYPLDILPEY